VGDLHIWRQWPEVQHACCIDADPDRLATWADTTASDWPAGWRVLPAVVADTAGVRDYHSASNRDEDGLLPTELLQTLWPRLQRVTTEARPTQPLDALVCDVPSCGLIVDCLPALPVLRGAAQTLARSQWLCVRVAELGLADDVAQMTAASAVTDHLTQVGFNLVAHVPGNHPAVGYAFYARDWHPAMQHLQQQHDAEAQAKAALQKTTAELQQAQANLQAQLAAEIQAKQAETAAKAEALKQRDAEAQAKAALQKTTAELQKTQADLQAQLAAETKARQAETAAKVEALKQRDVEATAKAETLAQRDAERRTRAALEQRLQQEEVAKVELQQRYDAELENQANQQNVIAQCQQRNAELEAENAQLQLRQRLLQEDLVRAEAQMDLIKDLLLREPGL
ncbi:MAG: hypothetical protein ACMV1D_11385, partial [Macromonas sp.]